MSVGGDGALRVAVVTGTRAEFGLLLPVVRAMRSDALSFEVGVVCCGAHLVGGGSTWREVERTVGIDARVGMQVEGGCGRGADARAVGRGVMGMCEAFEGLFGGRGVDWVLVLGDRIEAFAAASAASIGGLAVAHVHGGDRAEGVADEAMRHAITKLSHLHLVASEASAVRVRRMGEPVERVVVTGSPAVCGVADVEAMDSGLAVLVGLSRVPRVVVLHHGSGLGDDVESAWARALGEGVARAVDEAGDIEGGEVLLLGSNGDDGSRVVREVLGGYAARCGWMCAEHFERGVFLRVLAAVRDGRGALVGNSSAGLIEAAAMRVGVVNCGPRQAGRERAGNVIDVCCEGGVMDSESVRRGVHAARELSLRTLGHPYGDGDADVRIASALRSMGRLSAGGLRKRCVY